MEVLAEIKLDEDRTVLIIRDVDDDCYRVYNRFASWGTMLSATHPRGRFENDDAFLKHIEKSYEIIS